MDRDELCAALEAVLFIAGEPMPIKDIADALEVTPLEVGAALDALKERYAAPQSGLLLARAADSIQLVTKPACARYVELTLSPVQKQSLSASALETLSVVAYKQPVTRPEVEAIRGVMCGHILRSLQNLNLIREVGRKDAVGRPILYGTTDNFLRHFGLSSLDELPKAEVAEEDENTDIEE